MRDNGHESGEVENVYIYVAYDFSHFVIELPNVIKMYGNLTKICRNSFAQFFSETRCIWHGSKRKGRMSLNRGKP